MKTNISDVFFDLDHTLWDFEKNSALTFQKIFQINDIDLNLNHFLNAYKAINDAYWVQFRNGTVDRETLRFGRLNDTFIALNYQVKDEVIFKLSDDYITNLSTFNFLFEDTISVLEYLKPKYNLHIITNGFDEVQTLKLKGSNIYSYFKTITNSEQAGVKKPHPGIFKYALNQAKAKEQTSVMIGDNFEADILGGINAGFQVIYFNSIPLTEPQNVTRIEKLIELKNYL